MTELENPISITAPTSHTQLSSWMEGLQKQLSTDLCTGSESVEALQALMNQQQQQQANTQVKKRLICLIPDLNTNLLTKARHPFRCRPRLLTLTLTRPLNPAPAGGCNECHQRRGRPHPATQVESLDAFDSRPMAAWFTGAVTVTSLHKLARAQSSIRVCFVLELGVFVFHLGA